GVNWTINANNSTVDTSGTGNIVTIGSGSSGDILNNLGNGTDTFRVGAITGQNIINNGANGVTKGEVDFTTAHANQLWFQESGNDLLVDLLGTTGQIKVAGWYSDLGDRVQHFGSADNLKLDSQLTALVSAMATYAAAHPGFDPVTATQMPAD